MVMRHPKVHSHGRFELCRGPWSLWGPRGMAKARFAGMFLLGRAARLHQMYRMMAPAGVTFPVPSGGTPGRHAHGCLLSPSGHRAEHEVSCSWTEWSSAVSAHVGDCRDGLPSLSKWTVRGFALRVECTGPRRHVGESAPKLGPSG